MSDHSHVEDMVRKSIIGDMRVVRVGPLRKDTSVKKYQARMSAEWQTIRVNEVRGVRKESENLQKQCWYVQEMHVACVRWEVGR